MRDWKRVVPLPLLIILFGILTFWVYQGEQQRTIADHQSRQLLLAQQASRSIQSFFEHSLHDLTYLAGVPQIIDFSDAGKQIMLDWFAANRTGVQAITRVDSLGHILSTVPFNPSSIGADIHNQLHVQRILATHQPVISDVFRAVQGYDAVAVHVPVFADLEFRGSLALLIPFEHLVASCLENIRSSAGSEMLVISRAGVELYSQLPAPDPAAASTVSLPAPYLATLEAMRQGKEGAAEFILPDTSLPGSKASKRYAAFSPVELGDTHWSICISDREEVVLSATATFRQQLLLLFGLILLIVLVYFYYFLHARMILRTEKERIQNEERLRESEEKYRSILREIAEGYIELDLQGRIEFVGQPMEKISGYSGEQLLGRPFTQFINAASAGVYEDTRQAMLQTAASTRHLQMDLVHQDGGERQVEVSFTQKADRAGNPTGLRAVIRDVTARIQAERELRELEINLQQARKMEALGTLAGGVAHDLNNILSGIVSYPDYLLTQIEPTSKLRKPLEVIRDSGHKAAATVQDLLTLARRGVVSKDVV
nr:PAS domain S-box protein [bacterium]